MALNSKNQEKRKTNPESYIKLAKISLGLREHQLAAISCKKGLEKFPKHPGLLVMKGETLVSAFNHGKNIEHLKTAVESFEKAMQINPHNYVAKLLTGQIYFHFKKYETAIERFSSILEIDPHDNRARVFLEKAKKRLGSSKKDAGVVLEEKTAEEKPGVKTEEPPEEKEDSIQEDKKTALWETEEEDNSANHDFLIARLGMFNRVEGLKSVYLIDKNGNILKSQKISDFDPDLLCSMVGNIFRATDRVIDRFNNGGFVYSMVMCQNAFFYIVDVRWAVLVLETRPDTNQEIAEKKINQYMEAINV